jgi:serine O-acetyltransferase
LGAIHIGDDVAIGANAVVLQDVPPNSIAVGVPARVLPRRNSMREESKLTVTTALEMEHR